MNFSDLLNDKTKKPKDKTELLSSWLSENPKNSHELLKFAEQSKDPIKATCIEAFEFVSKLRPSVVDKLAFTFFTNSLKEKALRIKWESASVIGNVAGRHTKELEQAILNLIDNTEHQGAVVRWSAAFALGEILKLKSNFNKKLNPAIKAICEREEKNSIKKIYLATLKKIEG